MMTKIYSAYFKVFVYFLTIKNIQPAYNDFVKSNKNYKSMSTSLLFSKVISVSSLICTVPEKNMRFYHTSAISNTPSFSSLMGPLNKDNLKAIKAKGVFIVTEDGLIYLDGSSGAGVSSIGHRNKRVIDAINQQNKTGITYLSST